MHPVFTLCRVCQTIAWLWRSWYNIQSWKCVDHVSIGEGNMKTEISVPKYQNGDITKRLDEVYAKEDSTLEPELVAIQIASIGEEKW